MSKEMTAAEQEIVEMAQKGGFAPGSIAEQLEISVAIVYAVLKKFGVKTSRHAIGNKQTGLTDKEREQIAIDYANDPTASVNEMLAKHGISRTAFIKILDDFGVEYRTPHASRQELDARDRLAVKLYSEGVSIAVVQAESGITAPQLYVLLRRENIPLRRAR